MTKSSTDDLIQFMSQYSLESVLSGIIEMQMLLYGHDDTFIPASEYLAANVLYACKEKGNKDFMWHDYEVLEQYSKSSFAPNVEHFSDVEHGKCQWWEAKFLQSKMMQMKGNFYRDDGYIHQLLGLPDFYMLHLTILWRMSWAFHIHLMKKYLDLFFLNMD